jgi:transposase
MVDVIVERCAGLDVHRDTVVATVRLPGKGKSRLRRSQETRTFGTTIGQLERLSDWLAECGVTRVGMESTGCYWKTVFYALEDRFDCWLVNAKHLRNVPGRKSDVIDSRWCCELVELGLVRPSFVPPPEIRRLRDLTRLRSTQVQERTRTIERLEKVLQDAGIKLTSVASGVYSVSARAMLEALLGGVTDPFVLAELAKGRMRKKIPQLQEALASRFDVTHHGVLVAGLLAHIDALDQATGNLEARIGIATAPYADLIELLCTIPGVGVRIAEILIAECGVDMSVSPDRRPPRLLGGDLPRHQPVRPQTRLRKDPERRHLAVHRAHPSRPRRRPHQEQLPRIPLLAAPRPPRRSQSDRRRPARHPHRLLPHRPRPGRLPRARPRLAHPPPLTRTPNPPARQTARSARPPRHPPTGRLNH